MTEILPLFAICLILALLSHQASVYDPIRERYLYKEHLFFTMVILFVVFFTGLRTGYNDTWAYKTSYDRLNADAGALSRINWSPGSNPLFSFCNILMKRAGFSSQSFMLAYSAVTFSIFLWFLQKYSENILLSVFLFFTMGNVGFAMGAVKQCVATAFCLLGIDRLLHGRMVRFLFWVLIGVFFHPFAAMFLICPFLTFPPWTSRSFLMIGGCAFLGFSMQTWLSGALNVLSMVGVEYDADKLTKESVNIFRLLVAWAPIALSYVTSEFWIRSRNKADNLMLNLSTLCAEIMFIALFGNPIYFGRLAYYFLLFQAVSLPAVLKKFRGGTRQLLNLIVVLGYSGYSVYGNMLKGKTFDAEFSRMTLWRYLESLF